LELSQPIDVLARSGDPDNDDAKDVNLVQLIVFWGTKEVEAYKSGFKEGSNLKIRGTLSSRLTGHHHAPVLIEVTGLSRI
jgi:2-oxoglutarate dehydrogenase complex dehydrogenase (E1) component-like enzyme